MNTFKGIAYQILKDAAKPLHSNEITKIALAKGWLKSAGKTPEATMSAQLIVDINSKKEKSRFVKVGPSIFTLNDNISNSQDSVITKPEKKYKISNMVSTKQKGDIAEARITELIILYGDTTLSCYKPISDDEGIDLIVKEKGSLKTMYIQIKSRFGEDPSAIFTSNIKANGFVDNYSMAAIFCYFDTESGDIWDYVWFIPAPDFVKLSNRSSDGEMFSFVAGKVKKESNKWDAYLIDKRDLANHIIAQMKRL